MRDHLRTAIAARRAGQLVGSAVLEIYPDGALLRSVAVESGLRGEGLGGRLTEGALTLARSLGIRRVFLRTETAVEFFPRHGFRAIARNQVPASVAASVEFMGACPESAVVMERAL